MKHLPLAAFTAFSCIICLLAPNAQAGGIVTAATEANLRAALTGGGTVTFAVDGTITLASTLVITNDTVLDGTGHVVTLSGGGAVRILQVQSGVKLMLKELTLVQGKTTGIAGGTGVDGSPASGGAVLVNQGTLTALNCRFWTNSAVGGAGGSYPSSGGASLGGAVYLVGGVFNATNSQFAGNLAQGGIGAADSYTVGGKAWGGAVGETNSILNLSNCIFDMNQALGGLAPNNPGPGGPGNSGTSGAAVGGALVTLGGTSYVAHCSFASNQCLSPQPVGPLGGSGGATAGGAIFHGAGILSLVDTAFSSNQVIGGNARRVHGASGNGQGGAIFSLDSMDLTACVFQGNHAEAGTQGYPYGYGQGGGVFSGGQLRILQTLFSANTVNGGDSGNSGGAIYSTNQLALTGNTLADNAASGASGIATYIGNNPVPGSPGMGGAIFSASNCNLTNNTFANNQALGGACLWPAPLPPGSKPGGDGLGGALFSATGTVTSANNTLAGNLARGGKGYGDGASLGGGIYSTNSTVMLLNTIIANSASGSNAWGTLTDLSHNLSSDASCGFATASSLNSTDPKLGPLANYGGLNPTMPLLSGSPAIDGGALSGAPATDQRGRARPFGAAVDMGAFESSPPLHVIRGNVTGVTLKDEVTVGGAGTTTSSNGWFSLEGVNTGSYTVTPAHANYLFVPPSRAVNGGPDQLGVNFRAYRWNTLSLDDATNGVLHVVFAGTNGNTYRTLWSSNLASWTPVSTNTVNASSYFELLLPATSPAGFHRVVTP